MKSFLLVFLSLIALLLLSYPVHANTSKGVSYYDLLQIDQSADDKTIKKAYRKLALIHHPDKSTSDLDRANNEQLFVQLANAYEILSDATYRARYDYLLTMNVFEYDEKAYDWSSFNPETKQFEETEIVFGQGRFRYKTRSRGDAAAMFARAQAEEEAETRALIMSLIASFCVALTPLGYFYYGKLSSKLNERKRKQEANEKLRENQSLVNEYHREQAAEQERLQRENAQRSREIREARERALLAEADQSSDDEAPQSASQEQVSNESKDPLAAVLSDDEDDRRKRRGADQIYKCDTCRKKFKSPQQYEQHLQSNQHKKAMKSST